MTSVHCISRAEVLPFEVSDAARSEEEIKQAEEAGELKARVSQDVRLNGRYIDLRTPANQAIFKVQSGVCQVCASRYLVSIQFLWLGLCLKHAHAAASVRKDVCWHLFTTNYLTAAA